MSEENDVYDENGVKINYESSHSSRKVIGKIQGILPLVCVLIFLAIGFFVENSWGKAWLVFLLIPVGEVFLSAINSSKKKRAMAISMVVICLIYVALGLFLPTLGITYAWLKALIVFLLIPIVSIIIN